MRESGKSRLQAISSVGLLLLLAAVPQLGAGSGFSLTFCGLILCPVHGERCPLIRRLDAAGPISVGLDAFAN